MQYLPINPACFARHQAGHFIWKPAWCPRWEKHYRRGTSFKNKIMLKDAALRHLMIVPEEQLEDMARAFLEVRVSRLSGSDLGVEASSAVQSLQAQAWSPKPSQTTQCGVLDVQHGPRQKWVANIRCGSMYFYLYQFFTRAEDPRNRSVADVHLLAYPPSGRPGNVCFATCHHHNVHLDDCCLLDLMWGTTLMMSAHYDSLTRRAWTFMDMAPPTHPPTHPQRLTHPPTHLQRHNVAALIT